ncbi:MAG: hypothetical protein L6V78_07965 [Clostridium sp.]|nr:MAG: hypothetical protein L6V78_07965 [Clostridium sp.]
MVKIKIEKRLEMKKTIIGIFGWYIIMLWCFFGGLYFANVISLNKQNENLPNNNANTEKKKLQR